MRPTLWLLASRYDGLPVIPVEVVCQDYFSHLKPAQFIRQAERGDIPLPLVSMTDSQKSAKGIAIQSLADFLDARVSKAEKILLQMTVRN